jgi:hypothetical protein
VGFPEYVITFLLDEFVIGVIRSSLLKGRIAGKHNKQDDSGGKDVHTLAFVFLVGDLRSHVSFSTKFGVEHSGVVLAFELAGEAEVCNLKDVELREKNILWFYVAVGVPFLMEIVKSIHHLVEVGSGNLL